jgi:hypothetical protein
MLVDMFGSDPRALIDRVVVNRQRVQGTFRNRRAILGSAAKLLILGNVLWRARRTAAVAAGPRQNLPGTKST